MNPSWNYAGAVEMATNIGQTFENLFRARSEVFVDYKRMLARFSEAVAALNPDRPLSFQEVEEIHNEMCIAKELLTFDRLDCVLYEPKVPKSSKSIDFGYSVDGVVRYVDVKTIHPRRIDRFDQFEEARALDRFPPNHAIHLDRESGGGEFWHDMYASRDKMLSYALELEGKLSSFDQLPVASLAFCGNGFHWSRLDLTRFLQRYWSGLHSPLDPFAKIEAHHLSIQSISLARTIAHFGRMQRKFGHNFPQLVEWF